MKFLIVVDMQNDFITGSLGTKEAEAILPKVLEKIRTYRPEQIFVTQDTHPDNYLETNEGRHLPVAHCIAGSEGHALNPLVAEALEGVPADHFICKPTFGSTLLAEKLKTAAGTETPEIELVGLSGGSVHRHLCAFQRHPVQSDLPGKRRFRGRCLLRLRHAPVP